MSSFDEPLVTCILLVSFLYNFSIDYSFMSPLFSFIIFNLQYLFIIFVSISCLGVKFVRGAEVFEVRDEDDVILNNNTM